MNESALLDREVLEATYFDTFSCFRPIKKKVDGESVFLKGKEGERIYTDEPCALSVKKVSVLSEKETHYETYLEYKIFASPDKEVMPNDFIVVVSNGRTYKFLAGASACYISHNEISLSDKERA